jgi:phosphatidylserine/phosphatidylglycerophosphate/cardiolipin synthase-like enzyme
MLIFTLLHLCAGSKQQNHSLTATGSKLTITKGVIAKTTQVEVLCPPEDNCYGRIVQLIDAATQSIYVHAYQLTGQPLAAALLRAAKRGVRVYILADKTQTAQGSSTYVPDLAEAGVPVKIDHKPAIAHRKVMIIDGKTTLTGSYNWTDGAEFKNAENLVILENQPEVAALYKKHWDKRDTESKPYKEYMAERASKNKK